MPYPDRRDKARGRQARRTLQRASLPDLVHESAHRASDTPLSSRARRHWRSVTVPRSAGVLPNGAGMKLRQFYADERLHQSGIADLGRVAQERGGDLGIEQRLRYLMTQVVEHLKVLPARMDYLQRQRVVEQVQERREIDREWIDTGGHLLGGDLQQTESRIVRALT